MENNDLKAATQPPESSMPTQPATPQVPIAGTPPEESNKLIIWLIIGLVVVIILVGGVYLFLSRQQAASQVQTTVQAPTPTPAENLEGDLNSIDVDSDATSDFTQVDQDLQQL